jgi:hypothetical protein
MGQPLCGTECGTMWIVEFQLKNDQNVLIFMNCFEIEKNHTLPHTAQNVPQTGRLAATRMTSVRRVFFDHDGGVDDLSHWHYCYLKQHQCEHRRIWHVQRRHRETFQGIINIVASDTGTSVDCRLQWHAMHDDVLKGNGTSFPCRVWRIDSCDCDRHMFF